MKKLLIFIAIITVSYASFSVAIAPHVIKLIKERDEKIKQIQDQANVDYLKKQLQGAQEQAQPIVNALTIGLDTLKKNPKQYKEAISYIEKAIEYVLSVNDVTNQQKKLDTALYNIQNEITKVRQGYNAQILEAKKQGQ